MDTNGLKKFAQSARNMLIDQVTSKLGVVLAEGAAARREHPKAIKDLEAAIHKHGKHQIIDQVAYTWFNRFTALRFMDANGYTNPRIVSPADGATRPQILAEAMAGNLPEGAPAEILALLDGRTPSGDPHAEAYRRLLVHACNHWHGPMPFLFEQIDDYTEFLMPEDLLSQTSILADLCEVMTDGACRDVEIIGWLYQFYISEKKDQVFAALKKNVKIAAENIPAATQLFTPHWIVRYLVENSLGRLWLLNRPASRLAEKMDYYIAPDEPETDFLRISRPEDIRICDPACGSGHMLTYAFDLLYAIYEEEGYEAERIPALILTHNLTGIEIDDRAGALAAFALAMKAAAKLGRRRFLRMEVKPEICVLQNVALTAAELRDVAAMVGQDLFTDGLRETLGQFEQAKNCGSLIVPKLRDPAETLRAVGARDFGGDLLLKEAQERVVTVLRMAEALSAKYHVVIANPPYMGSGGMNTMLANFAKEYFAGSKSDLFAMFIDRNISLAMAKGMIAMVTIQNWMFLSSFEKIRKKVVNSTRISSLVQIGYNSFPELNSKVVQAAAFVLENYFSETAGSFVNLNDAPQSADKRNEFIKRILSNNIYKATAFDFKRIPGEPIAYWVSDALISAFRRFPRLSESVTGIQGLITGNNDKFVRHWTEISASSAVYPPELLDLARLAERFWVPYTKGGDFRRWYGNNEYVLNWRHEGTDLTRRRSENSDLYFLPCVTWNKISTKGFAARIQPRGYLWDVAGSSIFPSDENECLKFISLFCSKVVEHFLSAMSPTINFEMETVLGLPLPESIAGAPKDIVATAKLIVSIARSDWDAYETSWDFSTLPLLDPVHRRGSLSETYVALRQHWHGMTGQMQALEERNNRIFIEAYGLTDELTSDVPVEEITLNCNPAYRYGGKATEAELEARLLSDTMAEFLHYAVGCMFGRYSLNTPGLILASHGEGLADYLARVPVPTFDADADNVVPVLDGDWFADDITDSMRKFLRVTFGEANFQEDLAFIEGALGKDIRKWFTRDFFDYHVRRYKKRPIYWMFSSPQGSFNALIYMHRYRPDTVSVVLNDYLREFISKLQAERGRLEKLSDDTNASHAQRTKALKDVGAVIKQIAELEEWEREVVFPLAQAKIEINLDDGVKQNYPLFGAALKAIKGLEATDD